MRKSVAADFFIVHILSLCDDWTAVDSLKQQLPKLSAEEFPILLREMIANGLLLTDAAPADPREHALDAWRDWNPAAGFFHTATKDTPGPPDPEVAERELHAEFVAARMPPRVKVYPGAPITRLQRRRRTPSDFVDTLLTRRTWRQFSSRPVSVRDVSTLLELVWGVQERADSVSSGEVFLKTSPSSGARQPLETYLLAVNVSGLKAGLYHYRADEHCLELIKAKASRRTVSRYLPRQWWYESASALFMMTAVFARTRWRYKLPRAYRSVLLEAGHACQTFCLAATWLGLAPFCTGRFSDAHIEHELGIDGIEEAFVYGAGVGTRPRGMTRAPWPRDVDPESPISRRRAAKTSR